MDWQTMQIAACFALVVVVFWLFVRERPRVDVVAMGAAAVLLALGILGTGDVLAVFGNGAPITVACLFVLSGALERTGVISAAGRWITRRAEVRPRAAVLALLLAAIVVSAFVNNTPVVVVLTPVVMALARTIGIASSRLLMPLSFASILGGTTTLIGTSTNILVDGSARTAGLAPFGMFEITGAGAVMAVVGLAYLLTVGRWLLPERETLTDLLAARASKQYLAEVVVPPDAPCIGQTIEEAGLTGRESMRVIDVIRNEASLRADLEAVKLAAGDRLVLRTGAADVMELRALGFAAGPGDGSDHAQITRRQTRIMEGVLGPQSQLVGRRVSDLYVRRLYGIYILAIHRRNASLRGSFDRVRLAFGDTLLLEGPPERLQLLFDRGELVNLAEPSERPLRRDKAPIAIGAIVLLMVLATIGVMPIAGLALIAAVGVVAAGCLEPDEAYASIHWPILFMIFGMLALGAAMETTGAAVLLAETVVGLAAPLGPVALLSAVYLVTTVVTAVITNNAAAILLTPIAVGLAAQAGLDPRPFAVAVMFAASASFATPIGYQTNAFVYAAGGYRFMDFVRVGLPLNLLLWGVATVVIPMFWPLKP